jgi:hypothetical protein
MSDDTVDHVNSIDERIRYYDMHIRELRKQESIAGVYADSSIPVRIQEYERRRNACYEQKQSYQNQFIAAKRIELQAFISMREVLSSEHASKWVFSKVIESHTHSIPTLDNITLADMIIAVSNTCDQNISRLENAIAMIKKLWNISE